MTTHIGQNLGKNLEYLRKKRGLTQGKLFAISGIPRTTLSYIESGHGNPCLKTLSTLAVALGVSIEELLAQPRPICLHVQEKNLKHLSRSQGKARILTLLPDPIPGLQFEKLVLRPLSTMVGTPHAQLTKEYFTCSQGRISVSIEGDEYLLEVGDVLAFPGDSKHSYHNPEETESQGISIVVLQIS